MKGRRWAIAVLGVATLGVGAAAARWWAGEEVVRVLKGRSVAWTARHDTFGAIRLEGISGPGLTAAAIQIDLIPAPAVVVERPVVDITALQMSGGGGGEPSAADASGAGLVPVVRVEDLTVKRGEDTVVKGWEGTVLPRVSLGGPGGSVSRTLDGEWSGSLEQPIAIGPLSGQATVSARCSVRCSIVVDLPEAVVEHDMLASGPLPPHPLKVEVDWDDGKVDGTVQYDQLTVRIAGTVTVDPIRSADLTFEVPDTPLQDIVELFGDLIPEARRARVVGTVGASGSLTWPGLDWTLTPRMDGLGAEGVLLDADGLRNGTVTWATPDDSGVPRMRRTGRTEPHFVPFQAAGLFPAAVLAAEDSGFSRHNGVDLIAIQAALDDARDNGVDGMRGGSTITQQLAKNLFLETRERTAARKLRELLYALELDRVVPKQRILELYINVVELGEDIYGIGPAADAYFLKQPGRLTVQETAFLAALLPAPKSRGRRAWRGGRPPKVRMDVIIDNMRDLGRIDAAAAAEAKRGTLRLVPPP